jgi:secreted PhoX family phosphatase
LFEVINPTADVENISVYELNSVPNVSHEGLRFNHDGSAFYFVDEDRSGSVYKFVPTVKGNYSKGQTFVLSVNAYTGAPEAQAPKYSATIETNADRSGMATWVAMTDVDGNALTSIDPFNNEPFDYRRSGRAAADELDGTPYRRPEDVEVGYLKNGHEALYFTATEELAVYSVEELGNNQAIVRLFADESTFKNLGHAATTGHIDSPDNLAQDALGNIYMVEDWPNGDNVGGDIWFLRDTNNDGVAESVDHFMS